MTMPYRIEYHPLAAQDLFDISIFIGSYAGERVADRKLSALEKATGNLRDFPHIGTIRSDIHPGLRVIVAAEKGVICFTVDDDTHSVFIIAISYAGADWQARVGERAGE